MKTKIREEFIIMGVLIVWALLLAGCTSETNDNSKEIGTLQQQDEQTINQDTSTVNQQNIPEPTDSTRPQRPSGPRGNMSESFTAACNGKNAGDICLITMRDSTINGTCIDRNGSIYCTPGNMGNRTGGQRPGNWTEGRMPTGNRTGNQTGMPRRPGNNGTEERPMIPDEVPN